MNVLYFFGAFLGFPWTILLRLPSCEGGASWTFLYLVLSYNMELCFAKWLHSVFCIILSLLFSDCIESYYVTWICFCCASAPCRISQPKVLRRATGHLTLKPQNPKPPNAGCLILGVSAKPRNSRPGVHSVCKSSSVITPNSDARIV